MTNHPKFTASHDSAARSVGYEGTRESRCVECGKPDALAVNTASPVLGCCSTCGKPILMFYNFAEVKHEHAAK